MRTLLFIFPIVSGALWGSVGIFVRGLREGGLDSVTIISTRVICATAIFGLGMLVARRSLFRIRLKDLWIFAASGLLGMFGLNYFYNTAIELLDLSLAAVLLALCPVFVMLAAAALFGERITPRKIICVVLAIIGCALCSGAIDGSHHQISISGVACGVLSAVFYALYSVLTKCAIDRGYSVFTMLFYSVAINMLALLPFTNWGDIAIFAEDAPIDHLTFMLAHAFCASVLPHLAFTFSMTIIETGLTSILAASSEPIAAAVFGILFFDEHPTMTTSAGLLVAVSAIAILCSHNSN